VDFFVDGRGGLWRDTRSGLDVDRLAYNWGVRRCDGFYTLDSSLDDRYWMGVRLGMGRGRRVVEFEFSSGSVNLLLMMVRMRRGRRVVELEFRSGSAMKLLLLVVVGVGRGRCVVEIEFSSGSVNLLLVVVRIGGGRRVVEFEFRGGSVNFLLVVGVGVSVNGRDVDRGSVVGGSVMGVGVVGFLVVVEGGEVLFNTVDECGRAVWVVWVMIVTVMRWVT
jgi:hypothetical protein